MLLAQGARIGDMGVMEKLLRRLLQRTRSYLR